MNIDLILAKLYDTFIQNISVGGINMVPFIQVGCAWVAQVLRFHDVPPAIDSV